MTSENNNDTIQSKLIEELSINDDKINPLTNDEESCILSAKLVISKNKLDSEKSLKDFNFNKLIRTCKYGKVYEADCN